MVQNTDRELKDSKKIFSNLLVVKSEKTQSQKLDKQSNNKTEKSHKYKFDPSGLPKYR